MSKNTATTEDTAQALLGRSYAQVRLEAAKLEAALFAYYNGGGPRPPGHDGPEPHLDLQTLAVGNAIIGLLGAVGYIGAGQEDAPSPNGPGGPVMRDVLLGLAVVQLTSGLADRASARALQAAAADVLVQGAKQIKASIA